MNILQDKPENERKQILLDSCDKVEKKKLPRDFDSVELENMREEQSEIAIELLEVEEQKKEVTAAYNKQIKELKADSVKLLTKIKNKFEDEEKEVYVFIDHEERMRKSYNELGVLVHSRGLNSDERQRSMQPLFNESKAI